MGPCPGSRSSRPGTRRAPSGSGLSGGGNVSGGGESGVPGASWPRFSLRLGEEKRQRRRQAAAHRSLRSRGLPWMHFLKILEPGSEFSLRRA
ncbi:LOW QUALITY PROTEIN: hypothetical protein MC885_010232 [Smutsia gigantea]|nr:LOW QUALITY PROTEIN: hypothetical protein MC885_010232 [Smutsia gigantea]